MKNSFSITNALHLIFYYFWMTHIHYSLLPCPPWRCRCCFGHWLVYTQQPPNHITNSDFILPTSYYLSPTYHQFCQYLSNKFIASLHLLSVELQPRSPTSIDIEIYNPSSLLYTLPTPIQSLIQEYQSIFQRPRRLPPQRPHDHHIPLLPHTSPIKVKPYRYLHHHKEIITKLITEMLQEGIIKPSTSPFSSPVLLIKKKMEHGAFVLIIKSLMQQPFTITSPLLPLLNC